MFPRCCTMALTTTEVRVALVILVVTSVLGKVMTTQDGKPPHPHIVFILADDLGWNDVSFHGSAIQTPNIDRLARQGVILDNYYVSPICTPTRSALMTGLHPVHTGMQHYVIAGTTPYGLPLDKKLMPQYLKNLGYATHIVGKWHLGHFAADYLPLRRGFDTHLGYYLGKEDYFDHTSEDQPQYWGLDFRRNEEPVRDLTDQYSTEIFTQEAETIIRRHNSSTPLFLYLAHQAVHGGNQDGDPVQAPQRYVNRHPDIKNVTRKILAGMASALDDSVGHVVQVLEETGMMKDTILVFSTDNGGPCIGDWSFSNNWPLRGSKFTVWEGGVRGVGLVYSPLLTKSGYVSHNLFHVSDWLPTLLEAAGGGAVPPALDGVSQWQSLVSRGPPARTELLHNIDPIQNFSAIRVGDYKLIQGDISHNQKDGWYPPPEGQPHSPGALHVHCGPRPRDADTNCQPTVAPCLYHVTSDPCELHNVAAQHPDVVASLQKALQKWKATMVPPANKPSDPRGDPARQGGVWGPWM